MHHHFDLSYNTCVVYIEKEIILVRKSVNNATRATKVIRMIQRNGLTWKEVSTEMKLSVSYLQQILRSYYKSEKAYNNLLAKGRANKKAKKVVESASPKPKKVKPKEIIVVETGYLLNVGPERVLDANLDAYIPYFCIKELQHLLDSPKATETANKVLSLYYRTHFVRPINSWQNDVLFEEPPYCVKPRSYGVVTLCCHLWSMGYAINLLTNSREIEELVNLQGIDVTVVRS